MSFHSESIFSIVDNYFFKPVQPPPIIPTRPIINNYYNVQPPYYSNPSYYSGLESSYFQVRLRSDETKGLLCFLKGGLK